MLYLIPTPIGNLGDITLRAIETLKSVDYVLCEDTRHSGTVMKHHDISAKLISYHKFNEAEREQRILDDLREGKEIALISDGGTPGIADPGQRLVRKCHEEGLPVTSLPGACAITVALTAAGAKTERFQFIGFLPKKGGELRRMLAEALHFEGTTVAYEAPKRILATLGMLDEMAPERRVCVARELSKKFEEVRWGTPEELMTITEKGEMVLIIEGESKGPWRQLSAQDHVAWLVDQFHISDNEAIKLAAQLRGVPKREIYGEVKG
jgi:16S rRNA (cytidine1402-2'-O)-methyltransferase